MIKIFTVTNSHRDWIANIEASVNAFEARDDIVVTGRDVTNALAISGGEQSERMTIVVSYVALVTPS